MSLYYKIISLSRAFTIIIPIVSILVGIIFRNMLGIFLGLYLLLCDVLNHYVKILFKKLYGHKSSYPILGMGERPDGARHCGSFIYDYDLEGIPTSYGMPSGHSQMATLIATFLIMYLLNTYGVNLYNIISISIILFICIGILYSRFHLKCHTIQQIIVGGLIGILYGSIGYFIYKKVNEFII